MVTPVLPIHRSDVDVRDVERHLTLLTDGTFEIRAFVHDTRRGRDDVWFGYFDDAHAAAAQIASALGDPDAASVTTAVYVTLNPVQPVLLARCANRLDRAGRGSTTGDQHIARRTRLLVDVDAAPVAGVSTSDAEHAAALALAWQVAADLDERGWPEPIYADSGNGAHLIYAIDLPRDDGGLVERVLHGLQARYGATVDGVTIKVDTGNHNPSRITKVAGTWARKGDSLPDRPHRRSAIIHAPDALGVVTREQLEQIALPTPSKTTTPSITTEDAFDVDAWLARYGLAVRSKGDWQGGVLRELEVCPFNADHTRGEASVITMASGALVANCKHESCTWTWEDLREKYEPAATRPNGVYQRLVESAKRSARASVDESDRAFADRDDQPDELDDQITAQPYQPISILAVEAARIEAPPIRSYSTGNLQLDNLLGGGLNTRELCAVCGPPGGCKTAWAMSTALYIQRVVFVLYASTELETDELKARAAANQLGCAWAGIRRGTMDRSRIVAALDGVQVRFLGCELLPRGAEEALALIEREAVWMTDAYGAPPAIFVDYLQDLARGSERDLRARVGDIAAAHRAMSQRLDAPVVAVSSIARTFYTAKKAAEFRAADDPTVYLAAAKESGDVDYAAARVLFLDAEDDRSKPERAVRIAVAKSRDGGVGFAGARVVQESGRFLTAPEAVDELSAAGRAAQASTRSASDHEEVMFARIQREHAAGNRDLCTKSHLREGNGFGERAAMNALDRLEHSGRVRRVPTPRREGGKEKVRDIYDPVVSA